jgi:hypothetical protein
VTPVTRTVLVGAAAAVLFAGIVGLADVHLRASSEFSVPPVEMGDAPTPPSVVDRDRSLPPGGPTEIAGIPMLPVTSIVQYHFIDDYRSRDADGDPRENPGSPR